MTSLTSHLIGYQHGIKDHNNKDQKIRNIQCCSLNGIMGKSEKDLPQLYPACSMLASIVLTSNGQEYKSVFRIKNDEYVSIPGYNSLPYIESLKPRYRPR